MLPLVPYGFLLAGSGLALFCGWRCRLAPGMAPLSGWGLGTALILAGLGLDFQGLGMPDHAATAYAAALALGFGHAAGLLLLWLSPGRPTATAFGLAMTLGLPPFGAFAGLWLGIQAIQASLLLLPAWPSLGHAAAALAGLAGWLWAWQGGIQLLQPQGPPRRGGWARALLVALVVIGGFLPWLWVLPAQVLAAWLTGELPMLLLALGMMLTPVIPGQASVIPFGLLAIAMALTSVLLLVLRLTRRTR